jgi:phosphatidylserine decarboxylase
MRFFDHVLLSGRSREGGRLAPTSNLATLSRRMSQARPPITFFNRHTGRVETETVYGEGFLRFVYENPLGALPLHALVKRGFFSRWYGWRMDRAGSRARVSAFIERYGVDWKEFQKSPGEYGSFNEFFARKLKPDARPVDPRPDAVVFPADGRHLAIADASVGGDFFVKGVKFDVPALLGNSDLGARFAKGSVLVSRLCPLDYHRFHFPCDGTSGGPRLINGPLYSVNPIALRRRPTILWENKRFITLLKTSKLGDVLLLEIGATCVGSVTQTFPAGQPVRKGDEKGFFRFGGSSFITIFEPGRVRFADDLLEHSACGREVYAKMGEAAAFVTS